MTLCSSLLGFPDQWRETNNHFFSPIEDERPGIKIREMRHDTVCIVRGAPARLHRPERACKFTHIMSSLCSAPLSTRTLQGPCPQKAGCSTVICTRLYPYADTPQADSITLGVAINDDSRVKWVTTTPPLVISEDACFRPCQEPKSWGNANKDRAGFEDTAYQKSQSQIDAKLTPQCGTQSIMSNIYSLQTEDNGGVH